MKKLKKHLSNLKILVYFIVFIWLIFGLSYIFPLYQFGLYPRSIPGLVGIISSHFIHGDFSHLLTNTVGLLTFGLIFTLLEGKSTLLTIASLMVIQGSLTWLLARSGNHIGSSGLIFGLFGYLASIGFFKRKIKYLAISILILIFYGTMIFGVLPTSAMISWEGHFFGAIAGVLMAKFK
ncbi:MAG: rhomboid family intramembrane serine protease [Bacteriovoracaceae bacterium]|nr:rhomboid family intramembrane serine protease [Bacteriovoracaceae bacterium]